MRQGITGRDESRSDHLRIIHGWAGASDRRERMASGAGIEIETRAEAVGYRFHFSERWYAVGGEKAEFARGQAGYRLACARRSAANSGVLGLGVRSNCRKEDEHRKTDTLRAGH